MFTEIEYSTNSANAAQHQALTELLSSKDFVQTPPKQMKQKSLLQSRCQRITTRPLSHSEMEMLAVQFPEHTLWFEQGRTKRQYHSGVLQFEERHGKCTYSRGSD